MPFSYLALKLWEIPILVFVVHLVIELIAQFIRIAIVAPKIEMSFGLYINEVYLKILPVFIFPLLLSFILYKVMPSGIVSVITIVFVQEVILSVLVYFIGLSVSERTYLLQVVKKIKP